MNDKTIAGEEDQFIAVAPGADEDLMDNIPCSAGHSACYVSPYGDVYPCVQFPLPSGNVRKQKFIDIWKYSPQLEEVRSIRTRDLPVCSTCAHTSGCKPMPRPRIHGRQHAGSFDGGLREIVRQNRDSERQYAA